jgi:hypothetical protein
MNVFSSVGVTLGVLAWYQVGAGWGWAIAFCTIGVLTRAVWQLSK